MEIKLKDYQGKAVNYLVETLNNEIEKSSGRSVVFKSPTGSGKTIMAGTIIKEIAEINDNVSFLWFSVANGELHTQSAEKIREFYPSVSVTLVDNAHFGLPMQHNHVYVGSWQKLNNKKNVFMREGENFNFKDFLSATRKAGTKIVLIVDESHLGAGNDSNISKVKELIDADATLNLSATPKSNVDYEVDFDDVISEGVIKKDVYVNKGVSDYIDKDELTRVVFSAMDKRDELARLYPNGINPLCIIQLPNGIDKKNEVEHILQLRNKTTENDKVAIWLSNEKKNLDNITEFDSDVEYLLFKSAVATGWDCTRAHILVKLRDVKSNSFEIQTVGRVLRMPEKKHYENEALNSAYIYSDLDQFDFQESAFKQSAIKTELAEIKDEFDGEIELQAFYRNRVQLSRIYRPKFQQEIYNILDANADQITFSTDDLHTTILEEIQINLNEIGEDVANLKTLKAISSPFVIDSVLKSYVKGISNVPNNKEAVRNVILSIVEWIATNRGWDKINGVTDIQKVILNQIEEFKSWIYIATEKYTLTREDERNNNEPGEYMYSPAKEIWYGSDAKRYDFNKYVYDRCFANFGKSGPELDFAKKVDSDEEVLFWYKNGDSGSANFSISYKGGNFFPDFIIKYKNGDVKIVEIKGAPFHVQDKQDALEAYGEKYGILTDYILV